MNSRKLNRTKLHISRKADVVSAVPPTNWFVLVENGKRIQAPQFESIPNGSRILAELNVFVRTNEKKSALTYPVLRYAKYVADNELEFDVSSLITYRAELDSTQATVNTKSSSFGQCLSFFKHLASCGVLKNKTLPANFKRVKANSKSTFYQSASNHPRLLKDCLSDFDQEIFSYAQKYKLSMDNSYACYFSERSMQVIHEEALCDLDKDLSDIEFLNALVKTAKKDELKRLKSVNDLSELVPIKKRTIDEAFGILYANYGDNLPPIDKWIPGVYDVFKAEGYVSKRIYKEYENLIAPINGGGNAFKRTLSIRQIEEYREIKDWRLKSMESLDKLNLCLKLLYSKFGFCLPPSTYWPKGVADTLKWRGWNPSRVASAFFPGKHIHQALLNALLSHDQLMLNVDSAFFYSYTNSITPAFEQGKVRLQFGKSRGRGTDIEISIRDPLVLSLNKYIKLYEERLSQIPEAEKLLKSQRIPLFLHLFKEGKTASSKRKLRTYDPGIPATWVRAFISLKSTKHKILKPLKEARISGENFRATHAVILKLKGYKQAKIKKRLNHGHSRTTSDYTDRLETKTLLNQKHREFQEFIVDSLRPKPNVEQQEASVEELLEKKSFSHRLVFKDKHLIAEWIAYRAHIIENTSRLMLNNPKRWQSYWQVKLAEYEGLLSLVDSKIYQEALGVSKEIRISGLD
ncbi:hypothetical protein [Idiomarina abyssalis]|uniref:hypothetical protein n=1 Tax=Idiomarina abyssalis TaxID=86102 RepID=UPI001CD41BE3|nr:hypothetical protein [Idiomarina abyssalis]